MYLYFKLNLKFVLNFKKNKENWEGGGESAHGQEKFPHVVGNMPTHTGKQGKTNAYPRGHIKRLRTPYLQICEQFHVTTHELGCPQTHTWGKNCALIPWIASPLTCKTCKHAQSLDLRHDNVPLFYEWNLYQTVCL